MLRPTVSLVILVLTCLLAWPGCGQNRSTPEAAQSDTTTFEGASSPLKKTEPSRYFALHVKPGQSFGFQISTDEDVSIGRGNEEEKNKQKVTYWYAFSVLAVEENGDAQIQATCRRVLFEGEYQNLKGKQTLTFDSDKRYDAQKEREFAQYFAPVGTPFNFRVDKEGRISNLSQLSGIIERFMGKENYAKAKSSAKEALAMDYGESALKNVVQLAFQKFEDRAIAVDSAWTLNWDGRLGYLGLRHSAKYTLKGYETHGEGKVAYITVYMKSLYTGKDKVDTGQGIATVQKFDISGQGFSRIDADHGLAVSRSFVQKVNLRFLIEPPLELKEAAPDQAKDFVMTQDARITNTITRFPL